MSTTMLRTGCPLDCPDACTLDVEVAGGRIARIDAPPAGASRANPYTAGFICGKVRDMAAHVYGDDRILSPAVRRGPKGSGTFEPVEWDEALALVAEKLLAARDEHGGASILPLCYGGSNGWLSQDATDARLFRRLGASVLLRTVCAAPTSAAANGLYGAMRGVALEDYVESRLIVLWGVNPSASGIHLVPVLKQAQERGAKLVVVDPRRTPLAKRADLHLAPRPGTDVVLALGAIRALFESGRADEAFLARHATGADELRARAARWTPAAVERASGVAATDLARFVDLYAETSPAVVRCGWGLERNRNGGSAAAAVLALPAVAGKFAERGGGYTLSNGGAWKPSRGRIAEPADPGAPRVNMNRVGRVLAETGADAIRVLFVYNANPLATLPDQERVRAGLEREDLFTVVFDQVLTDTARYADVILPATTFLEHDELRAGYGASALHRIRPVIEPVGASRSNLDVFAELCRRTGVARAGEAEDADGVAAAAIAGMPDAERVTRALADEGVAQPALERPVQFVDVFPRTPDSKVHLVPAALDREAPGGLYAYRDDPATKRFPLALISPADARTVSSTFAQLIAGDVPLRMHPRDAQPRALADGATVRVHNELGEVVCRLALDEDLLPGVVSMPKGLWARHTHNGRTSNALCPDSLTDLGGGACFNDARVEVEEWRGSIEGNARGSSTSPASVGEHAAP